MVANVLWNLGIEASVGGTDKQVIAVERSRWLVGRWRPKQTVETINAGLAPGRRMDRGIKRVDREDNDAARRGIMDFEE